MPDQITVMQWITFFFIYSFLGWIFESVYVSMKSGRWVNRGFLKGPLLPIYGSGAVMMLLVSRPFADNLLLTYFAGVAGATLLELVTGVVIEAVFKVRYWDYSYQKYNYRGYICLSSSVVWGFFTIGLTRWMHPAVLVMLRMVPDKYGDILFAFTAILFDVDMILSVREAVDLRDLLIHMENARHEMQLMKKRADVIMAVVDDEWREIRTSSPAALRLSELKGSLEYQLEHMKTRVPLLKDITEAQKREIKELQDRFIAYKNSIYNNLGHNALTMKQRVLGNPSMISRKYGLSLDALRHRIKEEKEQQHGS